MKRTRGHSVIEVALLAPWIFFLFVGLFDFGFYAHALISTENAARAAALAAASGTNPPCSCAWRELQGVANSASLPSGCNSAPLVVTVTPFTDSEGYAATRVTVAYQPIPLIPIPGLLQGQMTINRTVQMRMFGG